MSMKVLGIDTSGQTASAAIIDGDKLVGEFTQNDKLTHSQTILPMIAELCEKTNTKLQDIDVVACAAGPGSFTGLRIGGATAKGLCLGIEKPIVAVPTLDALAYNMFMAHAIICPIMDARRQQVYACFYEWKDETLSPLTQHMAESMDDIIQIAENFEKPVVFLGDGVPVHKEKLEKNTNFRFAPAHCALQRAASVAALGQKMAKEGKATKGDVFSLIYLRKSQAEREREERLQKEKEAGHDV